MVNTAALEAAAASDVAAAPEVTVGVAVDGTERPGRFVNPLIEQYSICMYDKVVKSVAVFMKEKVQALEKQTPNDDILKFRFPELHQHFAISQPLKPVSKSHPLAQGFISAYPGIVEKTLQLPSRDMIEGM